MKQISMNTWARMTAIFVLVSILAFTTKPVTVYVRKPIKSIRKDIGSRFKVPIFNDDDDQSTGDQQGDQGQDQDQGQAQDQGQPAQAQDQGWTWGSFATSVGTGAVAGGLGGAAGGAIVGSFAGGVGAGPGALAGAATGTVAGAVGGAVRYAWTYFGGNVSFVNVYVLPERALDFGR